MMIDLNEFVDVDRIKQMISDHKKERGVKPDRVTVPIRNPLVIDDVPVVVHSSPYWWTDDIEARLSHYFDGDVQCRGCGKQFGKNTKLSKCDNCGVQL